MTHIIKYIVQLIILNNHFKLYQLAWYIYVELRISVEGTRKRHQLKVQKQQVRLTLNFRHLTDLASPRVSLQGLSNQR